MGVNPEQPENSKQVKAEFPEIHEKDECSRCGNLYDSPNGCVECAKRSEKKKYQEFGEDRELALAMESARKSQHGRPVSKEYLMELAKIYLNEKRAEKKQEAIKKKRDKKQ